MGKYYKFKGNIDYTSVEGKKSLDRDINGLANNEMWFATIKSLNDEYEGFHSLNKFRFNLKWGMKFIHFLHLKKYNKEANEHYVSTAQNLIDLHLENTGVFSLTTDCLNNKMWSCYATDYRGYCVEYEFNDFDDIQLKHPEGYHPKHFDSFEKVRYTDKIANPSSVIYSFDVFKEIITQKTMKWSYENEFRIFVSLAGNYNHNPTIIKSIIFGLDADEHLMNYIIEKLKHKNLEFYKVKRERPDSISFIKEKIFV